MRGKILESVLNVNGPHPSFPSLIESKRNMQQKVGIINPPKENQRTTIRNKYPKKNSHNL